MISTVGRFWTVSCIGFSCDKQVTLQVGNDGGRSMSCQEGELWASRFSKAGLPFGVGAVYCGSVIRARAKSGSGRCRTHFSMNSFLGREAIVRTKTSKP